MITGPQHPGVTRRLTQVGLTVLLFVIGLIDVLYDWADRGDPWSPWLVLLFSWVPLYAAIRRW